MIIIEISFTENLVQLVTYAGAEKNAGTKEEILIFRFYCRVSDRPNNEVAHEPLALLGGFENISGRSSLFAYFF